MFSRSVGLVLRSTGAPTFGDTYLNPESWLNCTSHLSRGDKSVQLGEGDLGRVLLM